MSQSSGDDYGNRPLIIKLQVVSFKLNCPNEKVEAVVPILADFAQLTGLNQLSQNSPHFLYCIRIEMHSPEIRTWEIHKRFSIISALDLRLGSVLRQLPQFPSRGARRDITDSFGFERMNLLNKYFEKLCRMEEVVTSKPFMEFIQLDELYAKMFSPQCIGEINPMVNLSCFTVGSVSIATDMLLTCLNPKKSWIGRLGSYFIRAPEFSSNFKPRASIWRRLPNSFLYESISVASIYTTSRITCSVLCECTPSPGGIHSPGAIVGFIGCSEGRVSFIRISSLNSHNTHFDDDRTTSDETGLVPGIAHVGPTVCLYFEKTNNWLWSSGEDGMLIVFDVTNWQVKFKSICSSEPNVYATAIQVVTTPNNDIVYVGLCNGLISVFALSYNNESNATLYPMRLVTLLQGPATPVTSLSLSGDGCELYASHSAGVMDAVDGSNTVVHWHVRDILVRGALKQNLYGPFICSCMQAVVVDEQSHKLAVLSSNGTVSLINTQLRLLENVFSACENQNSNEAVSIQPLGSQSVLVAIETMLYIYTLASQGDTSIRAADSNKLYFKSSTEMSAVIEQNAFSNTNASPVAKTYHLSSDEDLSSWARS